MEYSVATSPKADLACVAWSQLINRGVSSAYLVESFLASPNHVGKHAANPNRGGPLARFLTRRSVSEDNVRCCEGLSPYRITLNVKRLREHDYELSLPEREHPGASMHRRKTHITWARKRAT